MKLFLKTLIIVIALISMVFLGQLVNRELIEKSIEATTLKSAIKAFKIFEKNYDRKKKTIIVIGPSTSILSFKDNTDRADYFSYANILEKNSNVLNLTLINLENITQFNTLLDFAYSKLPNADLLILENLKYLRPVEVFQNSTLAWQLLSCWGKSYDKKVILSEHFNQPTYLFERSECQKLIYGFMLTPLPEMVTNPCIKKYQNEIQSSYLMYPEERVKFISKMMACDYKKGNSIYETREKVFESYKIGFAQDLKKGASKTRHQLKGNVYATSQAYYSQELILINHYLEKTLEKYSWKKIVAIPTHAKNYAGMFNLPVFNTYKNRLNFIEMQAEIDERNQSKNLEFQDNFYDGTHANVWIHQVLADKINKQL